MLPPVKPRGRKLRERRHVINGIRCGADRCGLRRRNRLSVTSNVGPNVASCRTLSGSKTPPWCLTSGFRLPPRTR